MHFESPWPDRHARSRRARLLFGLIAIWMLIAGAIALAPGAPQVARAEPALLEIAAQEPTRPMRVIVRAAEGRDAAVAVDRVDGALLKELPMIHAVVAELPAAAAAELATAPEVAWVSVDAPVEPVTYYAMDVARDEFNTISYDNNDGTMAWAGAWVETLDNGSPSSGNIQVEVDDCPDPASQCIEFDARSDVGARIERGVDLSNWTTATLTFDYRKDLDWGEFVLEVAGPSGTFQTLHTFSSAATGSLKFDLTPYLAAPTRIRFRNRAENEYAHLYIDNVEVTASTGYSDPPSTAEANFYLDTLGVRDVWDMGVDGDGIAIAIVDSGVTKESDFGRRVRRQSSFNPDSNTVNDVYGHGTHVAGIAAGDGSASNGQFAGIAPGATILGLKIADENGLAYESDTVDALQWVLDNKKRYNIRVVNLSINSSNQQSYHQSALDAAVEILWFNEIVVVASSGNKGGSNGANTANSAPANDPFIITVGATDEHGTPFWTDDTLAPFSAHGVTSDGHVKPEILAPGTSIYSVLSSSSTWASAFPERVSADGEYFRLSGTSMSAPMVTGAVALLLQDEPELNPDQVKFRLMSSSRAVAGTPYLDVYAAVTGTSTEAANIGTPASQLLWSGDEPANWGSVSWGSVNWGSVAWGSVNWGSVNWGSVNWGSVAWGE